MAPRVGIEVSPGACRIVQLDRARSAGDDETVVVASTVAREADETTLGPYKGQQAAVVVWGLASDHRQAVVTSGMYASMRREAVRTARQAGVDTRDMLADISRVQSPKDAGRRRPVVIALARTSEVAAAVRPFRAAGVRLRSLVTPALALMSLARLRHRLVAPGLAEAYVALEETCAAIALVRDGALIAAREFAWGFHDELGRVRSREDVCERLGSAVDEFLGDCGARPSALAQICVCGGMPELRSATLALTERLDVEVEPLDSLFGINPDRLPSEDFRDRVAGLRLAWAVAADWNAPINFLRERRRRAVKAALTRAAIVGGIATGLGIAWRLGQSAWLEPSSSTRRAVAERPTPKPPPPVAQSQPAPPPQAAPKPPQQQQSPPASAQRASADKPAPSRPPQVQSTPAPAPSPTRTPTRQTPPISTPPPVVARAAPVLPKPQPAPPPPAQPQRQVVLTPVPEPVRPAPPRETQTTAAAPVVVPRRLAPVVEEPPLPFDATLGTILFGPDRKLAIVDGRIIQVGDAVKGARVVEITPNSVLFRDTAGRLRRLGLEQAPR